jgi:hypothetical protein
MSALFEAFALPSLALVAGLALRRFVGRFLEENDPRRQLIAYKLPSSARKPSGNPDLLATITSGNNALQPIFFHQRPRRNAARDDGAALFVTRMETPKPEAP